MEILGLIGMSSTLVVLGYLAYIMSKPHTITSK